MKHEIKITGRKLQLSDAVKRINPGLFAVGMLESNQSKPKTRAALEPQQTGPGRSRDGAGGGAPHFTVSLVACVSKLHDRDNLIGGFKPLRDAIAAHLGVNDADEVVAWEYGQCVSEDSGTIVRITTR